MYNRCSYCVGIGCRRFSSSIRCNYRPWNDERQTEMNLLGDADDLVTLRVLNMLFCVLHVLDDGSVSLIEYEDSPKGLIQSFVDRFRNDGQIEDTLLLLSQSDNKYFQL